MIPVAGLLHTFLRIIGVIYVLKT